MQELESKQSSTTFPRVRWAPLLVVLFASFLVLGFFGQEVYRKAPPIPLKVVTTSGDVLATKDGILHGQQVWQRMGGQQVGSIWGHGAYQAPDWSADWLHREALALQSIYAENEYSRPYGELTAAQRAVVDDRIRTEMRSNTFDAATSTVTVSGARAEAMARVGTHYAALFGDASELTELRENYAIGANLVRTAEDRERLNEFFFWTSWACATERTPGSATYTNNWPHEPLIDNKPTAENFLWSVLSIVFLLLGIGALGAYRAFRKEPEDPEPPKTDPLRLMTVTPSMRATGKYVVVVTVMLVLQVLLGALTAHYTVEGDAFFGLPLADYLPYVVTRTWHMQLAVFWIATAFLAAGLFLAPAIGGREPRFQHLGVNVLFGALVVVVGGSLGGEWAANQTAMDLETSFWFGTQGYEYVDLGRAWQIALFAGLLIWLALMIRGIAPGLRATTDGRPNQYRPIVTLFAGSALAIGLFYGSGFFYGARTHLSVMEYWRWWVVHLWVEGFMEVFATASIAFLLSRLGLVNPVHAARAAIASAAIFLVSGSPGTFHHLYFSGTPTSIMAIGSSFSALEVVPLVFVGYEAWETFKRGQSAPWMQDYKWPIRYFLAVAFWNFLGAGVFGFLINPPISLYYVQGLNTTPLHGHTAMFGVYGMLAIGLCLTVLRRLHPTPWRTGLLKTAFWGTNGGLLLMVVFSLLPIGLLQAVASVEHGLWYARSAELLQTQLYVTLRWMRAIGDVVFGVGIGAFALFVVGLRTGWSLRSPRGVGESATASPAPAK